MRESCQPSPEEIARAEAMMTPEQKAASEERAANKVQERRPFFDEQAHFTPDLDRKPPTPEQRERMDAELRQLGDLFAGSDLRWQLDGAINISLLTGDYIGVHKDVDVSVEKDDLGKLDGVLEKNGYGLFISRLKDEKDWDSDRIMERVSGSRLTGDPAEHTMIAAIDDKGKLRGGQELDFVDLHVVRRDADGDPVGPFGQSLPAEWYEPTKMEFQGREINVSNPALVAYFKTREGRPYDMKDVRRLIDADKLSTADVAGVAAAIERDVQSRRDKVTSVVGESLTAMSGKFDAGKFVQAFMEHPYVAGRYTEKDDPQLKVLEERLSGMEVPDRKKIAATLIEVFNLDAYENEQRGKIRQLEAFAKEHDDRKAAEAISRKITGG